VQPNVDMNSVPRSIQGWSPRHYFHSHACTPIWIWNQSNDWSFCDFNL